MKRVTRLFAVAFVLTLGTVTGALATPVLTLQEQGFAPLVIPGGGGGIVSFFGTYGTYTLNLTNGLSTPPLGSPTAAQLDLFSMNATSTGGVLNLTLVDSGFALPVPVGTTVVARGDVGGVVTPLTGTGSVTFQSWIQSGGQPALAVYATPFVMSSPNSSGSGTVAFGYQGPFTLTSSATIDMTGMGSTSFNEGLLVQTPEPASLTLLGTGLFTLAAFVRRRNRTNIAARPSLAT